MLRTPEEQFKNLPDYPFAPHYLEIENSLRMHYVDEGPTNGQPVLMLHGEPSWSFLYRHMIPPFANAGYRALAPDLIGFGKSDKLAQASDYSYASMLRWLGQWVDALALDNVILVCQDWGSLLGLRLVADHPERFTAVALANGGLPTGDQRVPEAFETWKSYSQNAPQFPIGRILQSGCVAPLAPEVIAAYDAPFPDDTYKAAARILPSLVPTTPNDPASEPNRAAWQQLRQFEKPFLTAFSDKDPITGGGDRVFQKLVPGAKGQPHTTIADAGHFLQEEKGDVLAQVILDWLAGLATKQSH